MVNLLIWLVVGALSGWLAAQVIRGRDLGLLRNILVGLIGGFLGGWLFGVLLIARPSGFLGEVIVSFCGAVVLLLVVRVLFRLFG